MNRDLDGWRLSSELYVQDIAILLSGGNPSDTEPQQVGYSEYEQIKRTNSHPGYDGYLMMLQSAIRRRELAASIRYPAYVGPVYRSNAPNRLVILKGRGIKETLHNDILLPIDEGFTEEWADKLVVERAPDWTQTSVETGVLKAWLHKRGITKGFFFESEETVTEDFMNPSHPCFSPELVLAVTAWRAVSAQPVLRKSPKSVVEQWITDNPEAWLGDEELSESAKQRVITLVNWQKTGGAPKSG